MAQKGSAQHLADGISFVVPCYKSAITLPKLVEQLINEADSLGQEYEVILVDDGSRDSTWSVIADLSNQLPRVMGLRLGRNFGQHSALLAGIRAASYKLTVTLDDDLQNPPDQVRHLVSVLDETSSDVVYGVPQTAAQRGWRRASGHLVRHGFQRVLGIDEAVGISSFRLFRTSLRDSFSGELGPGVSIDALLAWGTSSFAKVTVSHAPREQGNSHYSFKSLWHFMLDTMTGYSTVPLRFVSTLGFGTAAFGVCLMIIFVLIPLTKRNAVPGFPFLASTIVIFSGIQLITLGVFGEYLARIHFRIMRKPEFVIAERVGE